MTEQIVDAAVMETRAQIAWENSRGEPFTVQVAAFEALRKAYEKRVALCRKYIRDNPPPTPDDGPGLFGEAS